eukprot:g33966.t1
MQQAQVQPREGGREGGPAPHPLIHRGTSEGDLNLAKSMYYWGFCFLPWLWLVNFFQFQHTLKYANTSPSMKLYVRRSLILFIFSMVIWFIWLAVFYGNSDSSWTSYPLRFLP